MDMVADRLSELVERLINATEARTITWRSSNERWDPEEPHGEFVTDRDDSTIQLVRRSRNAELVEKYPSIDPTDERVLRILNAAGLVVDEEVERVTTDSSAPLGRLWRAVRRQVLNADGIVAAWIDELDVVDDAADHSGEVRPTGTVTVHALPDEPQGPVVRDDYRKDNDYF